MDDLVYRFSCPAVVTVDAEDYQIVSERVVSSVGVRMVIPGGTHATLTVFNRGGLAGTLTVESYDAKRIAERLIPGGEWDHGRSP